MQEQLSRATQEQLPRIARRDVAEDNARRDRARDGYQKKEMCDKVMKNKNLNSEAPLKTVKSVNIAPGSQKL